MLTRRKLLLGGAAGVAGAVSYPCYLEPRWLDLTETRISLSRPLAAPVRILHLTDLHASAFVPTSLIEHAVEIGLERKPDLVCVTGDFITHREDFDFQQCVRTLRRLSANIPVYAVTGNHDGGRWAASRYGYSDHRVVDRMLEESGIHLLHNRSQAAEIRNARITLAGVGDLWSGECDGEAAFRSTDPSSPVVVLAHNPDTKDELASIRWDLMLSGHTHGGQVRLPFQEERFLPVKDHRYVAGLGRWQDRWIYVSRGVGSLGGVRLRCRPEVTMLTLA